MHLRFVFGSKPSTRLLAGTLTAFACLSSTGCNPAPAERPGAIANAPAVNVELTSGNEDKLAELLESNRGKVVLVDFWATWCIPCVKHFPHTVELSDKHRKKGLTVISVSMNEPDDQAKVLDFLKQSNASFDNLLPEYGAGTKFADAFDFGGDIPFFKLYDRAGVLRFTFSGNPDGVPNCEPLEKMDERVAELLAENAKASSE